MPSESTVVRITLSRHSDYVTPIRHSEYVTPMTIGSWDPWGPRSRDAIAQFLVPPEPWERTTFRLEGREHLRHVKVAEADIGAYRTLLACVGGEGWVL